MFCSASKYLKHSFTDGRATASDGKTAEEPFFFMFTALELETLRGQIYDA